MIDYENIWSRESSTSSSYTWSNNTNPDKTFYNRPVIKYSPPEDLFYKGERFKIDRIDTAGDSVHGDTELTVKAHKVTTFPTGTTGCAGLSGTFIIDDPIFVKSFKEAFNPYSIKKVVCNPKKNATTVIFTDGSVEVVKRSPEDPEADIYSVVAYAVAKHIYGSNSAFKREVLKNIDFVDREFESIIEKTPVEDLGKALSRIAEHIKKVNKK